MSGAPLRILLSRQGAAAMGERIARVMEDMPHAMLIAEELAPGADADLAFVSRDVTGNSTKHELMPQTQHFYELLRAAASLRWVQTHAAGSDRPVFGELLARGVAVTTSSGANALVVAQSALAGVLALARRYPMLMAAQRERRWIPIQAAAMPRDLQSQTAVIVGWGPVGQKIAALLHVAGLRCIVVRSSNEPAGAPAESTVRYEEMAQVMPRADWLVLACPLSDRTRALIDARALAMLPPGAHVVNVARGEVVVQEDLVAALRSGALAGACLDVFQHEPLPTASPLWGMDNVIVTPHAAGHSDGNEERVAQMFLANLARHLQGVPLANSVARGLQVATLP